MHIGGLELENNIFLAPMAGITDGTFRRICRRYGAGFVYSEMVSAKGLHYKSEKTESLLRLSEDELPAAVQLFGSEPKIVAEAAAVMHMTGAAAIDINMGCPMPKITNNGEGSALMKNPRLAGEVIRAAAESAKIPVTVKIRSGWDKNNINAPLIAKTAQENGAAAVAVHGRTREQFYTGLADWDVIRDVKQAVSIPVIGNGDIFCATDAVRMIEYTGCDAVMVGRGAQGNPFIFRQIKELLSSCASEYEPTPADRVNQAIEHTRMLIKDKGEMRGVMEARKHIAWYIKGLKYSAPVKERIFKMTKLDEIEEVLFDYIQHYK